jgi:hypothetical protein
MIFGVRNAQKGEPAAWRIRDEFKFTEANMKGVGSWESYEAIKTFVNRSSPPWILPS